MITRMSFNQTAYADASADGQRSRVMPLGTVFRELFNISLSKLIIAWSAATRHPGTGFPEQL